MINANITDAHISAQTGIEREVIHKVIQEFLSKLSFELDSNTEVTIMGYEYSVSKKPKKKKKLKFKVGNDIT